MEPPAVVASSDRLDASDALVAAADLLEVRLDLGDVTPAAVAAYDGPLPLLLTNRSVEEGGAAEPGDARLDALADCLPGERVWGVDVESRVANAGSTAAEAPAAARLLDAAKNAGVRVVCSMHPAEPVSTTVMGVHLAEAASVGDIAKLAVPAESPEHLGELTEVTATATDDGLPVATMATGRFGPPSRLIAIALGCRLVYGAPPGAEPVVAGQPSVDALRTVVDASW